MVTLSIVTIVKDDLSGLLTTAKSVDEYCQGDDVEHVIWVNSKSAQIDAYQALSSGTRRVVVGADSGIWDAMNHAMDHATGNFILFLNARDVFVEMVDIGQLVEPSLIRVSYVDFFGRTRNILPHSRMDRGIPYCHQGVIFRNNEGRYRLDYKYCADYIFMLENFGRWPPPFLGSGKVMYDTNGVSSRNRFEADWWSVKVAKNWFGLSSAVYVLVRSILKAISRFSYNLVVRRKA